MRVDTDPGCRVSTSTVSRSNHGQFVTIILELICSLVIQCDNLNFDSHIVFTQPSHSNTGPYGTVIRHPLFEVPRHGSQCLVVYRYVVGVHAEDLRPTLASCVFEVEVYIRERLVNLFVDLLVNYTSLRIPSTWRRAVSAILRFTSYLWDSLTLPGTFDAITHADGLIVAVLFQVVLTNTFVRKILKV